MELFGVCQFGFAYVAYFVVVLSLEAYEEVVLVGVKVVLAVLVDVVLVV